MFFGHDLYENVENLIMVGDDAITGYGNSLENTITGNDLNNAIDGKQGADTLIGGLGDDTYFVDNVGDVITEKASEGLDVVNSTVSYILSENIEKLTLANSTAISATGNALDNSITGNNEANILDGGAGADILAGGWGNDIYYVDNTNDLVEENANWGTDSVYASANYVLSANVENLTLTGNAAINGTGNNLDNYITGNSAANTLDGGSGGVDTLAGGSGNDIYVVDTTTDIILENSNEGTDTVQSSVSYTLGANLENLTLTGTTAINATGNALNNILTGNSAVNTLTGGLGNDTYIIGAGDIVVEDASAGTDTVQSSISYTLDANIEYLTLTGTAAINGTGNALNNILTGNSAVNTLAGGLGNDTYVVDSTTDILVENVNEGTDTVQSSVSYVLTDNVERLTLTGSAAINGTGNALNNTLTGNSAINTLTGGLGNDTYVVGAGDIIVEDASAGTDTVQSSLSYTLGANLEYLTLTGTAAISGTGNALNNILTGNSAANTLTGGLGNDTYVVGAGDIVVEDASAGTDTVHSSLSYTLGANVENLTLTGTAAINGTGNALNNTLTGNSAINTLTGGLGDDTYVVGAGDIIVEDANAGTDTVKSSISYTLGANLERLTLTGTAAINATGNALNNILTGNSAINTLTGGLGNDTYVVDSTADILVENANEGTDTVYASVNHTLIANIENAVLTGTTAINATGNSANNRLTGNAGDNILNGDAGIDTLIGGFGSDTYIVDTTTDIITELAAGGTDTVQSNVTFSLTALANVENVTLTGTAAINATGNAADNILMGNSAVNTLAGDLGNDTYVVDSTPDILVENANEGTDTVQSSVTFSLAALANIENVTLTGTVAINATGNAANNTLMGNSANNILNGGAGIDTLTGGLGNDTYVVDTTTDIITENANEGTDAIQSSATYTLGTNLENLTLTGTAAINATGNALNNILTGNSAVNTLTGGLGNDTYVIGAGDIVVEAASAGTDTVKSSVTYTLGANLENLTLTGTATINGTGNTLNNILTGNSAVNTLTGGNGLDTLTGGDGADSFVFESATAYNNIDVITDFKTSQGDIIDIRSLMGAYTGNTATLDQFVRGISNGTGGLWLQVDRDGSAATHSFQSIASITNISSADISGYVTDGNLRVM